MPNQYDRDSINAHGLTPSLLLSAFVCLVTNPISYPYFSGASTIIYRSASRHYEYSKPIHGVAMQGVDILLCRRKQAIGKEIAPGPTFPKFKKNKVS